MAAAMYARARWQQLDYCWSSIARRRCDSLAYLFALLFDIYWLVGCFQIRIATIYSPSKSNNNCIKLLTILQFHTLYVFEAINFNLPCYLKICITEAKAVHSRKVK